MISFEHDRRLENKLFDKYLQATVKSSKRARVCKTSSRSKTRLVHDSNELNLKNLRALAQPNTTKSLENYMK